MCLLDTPWFAGAALVVAFVSSQYSLTPGFQTVTTCSAPFVPMERKVSLAVLVVKSQILIFGTDSVWQEIFALFRHRDHFSTNTIPSPTPTRSLSWRPRTYGGFRAFDPTQLPASFPASFVTHPSNTHPSCKNSIRRKRQTTRSAMLPVQPPGQVARGRETCAQSLQPLPSFSSFARRTRPCSSRYVPTLYHTYGWHWRCLHCVYWGQQP